MSGIEIVITPDQLDLEASMHIFLNYYKCQHIQLVKKKRHTNSMYSLQYIQFRAAMNILSIQPLGGSKLNLNTFFFTHIGFKAALFSYNFRIWNQKVRCFSVCWLNYDQLIDLVLRGGAGYVPVPAGWNWVSLSISLFRGFFSVEHVRSCDCRYPDVLKSSNETMSISEGYHWWCRYICKHPDIWSIKHVYNCKRWEGSVMALCCVLP